MKRSLLDPLPRQISTKALAALVALVVCGTGIAVARFRESSATAAHRPPSSVRAAPSAHDSLRASPAPRPSLRNAGLGVQGATPQFDEAGCSARAASSPAGQAAPPRGSEPTLARPDVEGT